MRRSPAVLSIVLVVLVCFVAATEGQAPDLRRALPERLGISIQQIDQLEAARGLNDLALSQIPVDRIPMLLLELQYPDLPGLRAAFRRSQEVSDNGEVPASALEHALQQLDLLRVRAIRGAVAGMAVGSIGDLSTMSPRGQARVSVRGRGILAPTAGLGPTGWTWLGPGNIGGRTRSIVITPADPNSIWAASVGGGVWHSTDAGATFTPVDDRMANLVVSTLVINPANSQEICGGTGEGYASDGPPGAGIFCTADGKTWSVLAGTSTLDFHYVTRLAIDPKGDVMLAGTRTGVFRSTSAARSIWSKTWSAEMASVAFDPTNRDRAIASGLRNGTAYYSVDGGNNWKPATHPGVWQGRVELTYTRKNSQIVYASVNNGIGEVWRSDDGGQTYNRRKGLSSDGRAISFLGKQGWYGNVIWAGDPVNSELVIVGGVDLWRSLDGGNTFTDISSWWNDKSAHADQHVIVSHPKYDGQTNRTVYFGNDGGIFRAADIYTVGNDGKPPRIKGWTRLGNDYGVTQFYGATGSERTGTILGGTQDNGTVVYTRAGGPQKWTTMYGGDGGWVALDQSDEHYLYGEYVYLNIHRSFNGGRDSEMISGQYWDGRDWRWKPPPYRIPDAQGTLSALFIAPFALDPFNPNRLLAGGLQLWRTEDARTPNTPTTGPKWASIKPGNGSLITTLAISPVNANVVWAGHQNGDIYRTANATSATPSWTKLDDNGPAPLPGRYITRFVFDPRNTATVYVTFAGFNPNNIWKTIDSGNSWTDITNGLPDVPIRAIALHPDRAGFIYLGQRWVSLQLKTTEQRGHPTTRDPRAALSTICSGSVRPWSQRLTVEACSASFYSELARERALRRRTSGNSVGPEEMSLKIERLE